MLPYHTGNYYLNPEQQKDNILCIADFFLTAGWTLNSICGMLGNMYVESKYSPGLWQSFREGNLSGGYGLVQWTPATKYLNWADANGYPHDSMEGNCNRILYEVQAGIQFGTQYYHMTFAQYTQSTLNPYRLAEIFCNSYERPKSPNIQLRGNKANECYLLLTENPPRSLPSQRGWNIMNLILYTKGKR